MPSRMWKYLCSCSNGMASSPYCERCGLEGTYAGWHYTMIEAMARYQKLYGLKPIGPHRDLTEHIFKGTMYECPKCLGRGLLDTSRSDQYTKCRECHGNGYRWRISAEDIQALRQQVLNAYPEALVSDEEDLQ